MPKKSRGDEWKERMKAMPRLADPRANKEPPLQAEQQLSKGEGEPPKRSPRGRVPQQEKPPKRPTSKPSLPTPADADEGPLPTPPLADEGEPMPSPPAASRSASGGQAGFDQNNFKKRMRERNPPTPASFTLSIRFPTELHDRLKAMCQATGKPKARAVRYAVEAALLAWESKTQIPTPAPPTVIPEEETFDGQGFNERMNAEDGPSPSLSLSLRLPAGTFARLAQMCSYTDQSKSEAVRSAVEVAIDGWESRSQRPAT